MSVMGLKGMRELRPQLTAEEQDKKLRDVAKMYEGQFLREMLKSMRETVQESGFVKVSQAEKIFRDQLDGEYVDAWGNQGGIGLADMIHQQLLEKFGAQLGIKAPVEKPRGPLAITEKFNFVGKTIQAPSGENSQKLTFRFDRTASESDSQQPGLGSGLATNALKAPWEGVLLGTKKLGADEHLMQVQHPNGLKSQFVFRGLAGPVSPGSGVQAGQTIGILSPEAKAFFWTLEQEPGKTSE